MEGKAGAFGGLWSAPGRAADPDRARALFVLVLPGIWVAVVLALELVVPAWIELTPLLAAAPAIACAGTGRKQCVVLAGLCALLALVPVGSAAGAPGGLGQRIGAFGAILGVAVASFVVSHRRRAVLRQLERARFVAETAQRLVFRPPRATMGDVRVAVRCASATAGAAIGGDLLEVVETPFGVRALIGDVRGSGLDAVVCASVLVGSFRETAYDEPDLRDVVHRLELSLRRHLGYDRLPAAPADCRPVIPPSDAIDPWQLSDVLTRPRLSERETVGEEFAGVAVVSIRPDNLLEVVNHGHPPPHLISAGRITALDPGVSFLPLGLGALTPPGLSCCQLFVVPFTAGDAVLLATDGVTAARDLAGRPFDLAETVAPLADAEPAEIVAAIGAAVAAHTRGGPADDLAMVLLRKTGDAGG